MIPMSQKYLPRGSIEKPRRIKEEPPTEMKKVPYRIEQQEEGDQNAAAKEEQMNDEGAAAAA